MDRFETTGNVWTDCDLLIAKQQETERVSDSSLGAGSVSVSDLEKFIYETRDGSDSFETEQDEFVALGINEAMDGLKRLIAEKKSNLHHLDETNTTKRD